MSTTATEQRAEVEFEEWLDITLWQCRRAIAAKYFDHPGRLDCRWLWSRHGAHYFRVNWWQAGPNGDDQYIRRSAFITVEPTDADWSVREQTAALAG